MCSSSSLLCLSKAKAEVILTALSIGRGYILIQHSLQKSSKKALSVGHSEMQFPSLIPTGLHVPGSLPPPRNAPPASGQKQ